VGAVLLCGERRDVRSLALCGVCWAYATTVKHSNPFRPFTRPLSSTGEREHAPSFWKGAMRQLGRRSVRSWITGAKKKNRDTEIMERFVTRRFRPTRPPGRSGPLDRTAGGIGGAAPASLDLYGQSSPHFTEAMSKMDGKPFNVSQVDLFRPFEVFSIRLAATA